MNDVDGNGALPEGWAATTMGDVAQVVGGGTPKTTVPGNFSDEGGHAWLTPSDLTDYRDKHVGRGRRYLTDQGLANSSAKYMRAGTVLFSSRAPIGYVAIATNAITTNQGFRSFVPSDALDSDYAYHYLKSITALAEQLASGTTFNELSGSKAKTLPLPLPPLAEQQRIATRLDQIEARRVTTATHLHAAGVISGRLRSAVLAAACSGRLTEDWRERNPDANTDGVLALAEERRRTEGKRFVEPRLNPHASGHNLPGTWTLAPLGVVLGDLKYGTSKRSAYDQAGTPVLRIPNVSTGVLDVEDLKFADLDDRERDALLLCEDDVLLIRSNGSVQLVGVTAAVTPAGAGMAYAGYLMRLRVDTEFLDPQFLGMVLASPQLRNQIELPARSTSGVHNINTQEVRGLGLPLPSLDEQREIVRRVPALLATADQLSGQVEHLVETLDRVSNASLAKAFRGELVPTEAAVAEEEGRNYEPADELLARVKSAGSATPRRRRTS